MEKVLFLAAGSMVGGVSRWWLGEAVSGVLGREFPYGTLLVNLSGCLILGVLHGLGETRLALGPQARLLLMAGFCGAFTTFSTWMLEASSLIDAGRSWAAAGYLAGSLLAGLLVFRLGYAAASWPQAEAEASSQPGIPFQARRTS